MAPRREAPEGLSPLPDHLAPGLTLVFVGINPGVQSAKVGHYFASPRNRFWTAFNLSGLACGNFGPGDDGALLAQGIGFTDVVKRPTHGAADLTAEDFRQGVPVLKGKLLRFQPRVVCFHGLTAYGNYLRYAEGISEAPVLGVQPKLIEGSRVFVAPNPSPANAAVSLDALVTWYTQLKSLINRVLEYA